MSGGARTHWTLALLVLWTSLWGVVSSLPLPGRTNATSLLERRWETLFSRSYLGISGGNAQLNWERDYLLGIKRVRRLYCNVGIGFHLQVLPDGTIGGVHSENQYSELQHPAQSALKRVGAQPYEWVKKKERKRNQIRVGHCACMIFNKSRRRG